MIITMKTTMINEQIRVEKSGWISITVKIGRSMFDASLIMLSRVTTILSHDRIILPWRGSIMCARALLTNWAKSISLDILLIFIVKPIRLAFWLLIHSIVSRTVYIQIKLWSKVYIQDVTELMENKLTASLNLGQNFLIEIYRRTCENIFRNFRFNIRYFIKL